MTVIDILGASPAALSMIFELIKANYRDGTVTVRIIKNVGNDLDLPFAVNGVIHEIVSMDDVNSLNDKLFLGVYKAETKQILYKAFADKYDLSKGEIINLIHNQVAVASTVEMGKGVQISPMTTLAPYSKIEDFVSLNRNVTVGHHSKVGRFCTLNPGVHVAGHCEIAQGATIGMGALVLDGKRIGNGSIVAAGSLVTKDVPPSVMVMGTPAQIVKQL